MKTFATLSLAILVWLIPASRSSAAVVSWGFSGVLSRADNNSNAVPSNITVGMPFSGYVTYDTAALNGGDYNPSASSSQYYFSTNTGITVVVQIGGTTFSSTNRNPGNNFAGIAVRDNLSGSFDELNLYTAGGSPLVNGAPIPFDFDQGAIEINFKDFKKTAVSSDALPTFIPGYPQFDSGSLLISANKQGSERQIFYLTGSITATSPFQKVFLSMAQIGGSQLRLSWPVSATGLTLQYATSLTAQDWTTEPTAVVDTATEHTVTVPTAGQPKFFRLVKISGGGSK